MIGERYVLLVWCSLLLVPWLAVLAFRPACRGALMWSSAFALPFGFSDVMFQGSYWSPPTLFDLARTTHLDIESFVFLFAAGGVAATAFNAVTGRPIGIAAPRRKLAARQEHYNAALAAPLPAFALGLLVFHEPMGAGVFAMAIGVVARTWVRPDLAAKTFVGALLFLMLYVALLGSLALAERGYIDRYWTISGRLGARAGGLPLSEWLFGASFGAYWSGLFEHYRWTFARRRFDLSDSGRFAPWRPRARRRRRE